MSDLILYLALACIGYFLGSGARMHKEKFRWTGKLQTLAIVLLVFAMGSRMGANDEVIENLRTIGIYALLLTLVVFVFSVISVTLTRKLLRIDRYGHALQQSKSGEPSSKAAEKEKKLDGAENADTVSAGSKQKPGGIDRMTIIILISVALGLIFGYVAALKLFPDYATFDRTASLSIRIGLCILLFFVGMDLGLDGTVIDNFKKVGWRVLLFPFSIAFASLLAAGVCTLFIPVSMKEMLSIGAGFGWYSLAPGIILDAGYVTAGAISFIHNVLRELLGIVLIPIVARHVGHLETISLPGAAAMDVCLPIVERVAGGDVAVYSFISGVILSILVPILVPILIG